MANAGKNKLLCWARLFVDGYDLSSDSVEIGTLDNTTGEVPLFGWSDSVKWFCSDGLRSVGVKGYKGYLNDTALSGAYTLLKAPPETTTRKVSLLFGGGAEPTYGDPAYLLGACQLKAPASFASGAAMIEADFVPRIDYLTGNPWGVVLSPNVARGSSSFNGTAVDNGAATTTGWHANLHVIASGGGTWAYTIEQSATGAWGGEETTLGTFALDGSAIASEYLAGTGNVAQYIRAKGVRTSSTCTVIMTFARK